MSERQIQFLRDERKWQEKKRERVKRGSAGEGGKEKSGLIKKLLRGDLKARAAGEG